MLLARKIKLWKFLFAQLSEGTVFGSSLLARAPKLHARFLCFALHLSFTSSCSSFCLLDSKRSFYSEAKVVRVASPSSPGCLRPSPDRSDTQVVFSPSRAARCCLQENQPHPVSDPACIKEERGWPPSQNSAQHIFLKLITITSNGKDVFHDPVSPSSEDPPTGSWNTFSLWQKQWGLCSFRPSRI